MAAEKQTTIECTLPVQTIQVGSLHVDEPRQHGEKILFPIRYTDPLFTLQCVSLLLPPLKLKGYSATTQLLEVYADPILGKLQTIQDTLLGHLAIQPEWLSTASLKKAELQQLFQPILKHNILTVFLHPKTWIYKQKKWVQGPTTEGIPATEIQLILRLQGLQVLPSANPGKRVRIQHQTLGVLCS